MSVILNALRSKEAQKKGSEPQRPKEGLFVDFEYEEGISSRVRVGILFVVLFSVCVFSFVKLSSQLMPEEAKNIVVAEGESTQPLPLAVENKFDFALELKKAKELLGESKWSDSLAIYERLIKVDSSNADILNDIGFILLKQNQVLEAESRFKAAVKLNPKCAECYNNLGMLSTQVGRLDEATEFLKKAIQINPNYPDPHFNLAVLLQKAGDITTSRAHFEDFLNLTPQKSAPVALQVRKLLNEMSAQEETEEIFEEADEDSERT